MSQGQPGMVVTCGSCGTRLRVREELAGKIGKCPKCHGRFQIAIPKPAAKKDAPAAPAPPRAPTAQTATPLPLHPARQDEGSMETAPAAPIHPVAHQPSTERFPAMPREQERQAITESLTDNDWQRGMSPEILREIEAENARLAGQGSISIGVLVFASLVAGAAVCFQVARYGGAEHWVAKRSVAAWLVGMMTAGAMLVSSGHRAGAVRFLAAVIAAAAVIGGKLFAAPTGAYQPIDILLIVLAIAGSTFTFLLAEPSRPDSAHTAHPAAAGANSDPTVATR
jgi:hypothetical protein